MVTPLAAVRDRLEAAGIPDAVFEAAQLYMLATGRDARLSGGAPLTAFEQKKLDALCEKRCARFPLQYLCGEWDFLDLTLKVGPDALAYLRANNAACGRPLCVVQADVLRWQEECAPGSFDVIVSNPPYIAPEEMAGLQPELFHEPRMALEAPDGGLAFYKHIAPAYFGALKPGGRLILEIGWRQADAVCALCLSAGYEDVSVRSDLSGNPRCVLARRPIAF